jgi:hypothetical protein
MAKFAKGDFSLAHGRAGQIRMAEGTAVERGFIQDDLLRDQTIKPLAFEMKPLALAEFQKVRMFDQLIP